MKNIIKFKGCSRHNFRDFKMKKLFILVTLLITTAVAKAQLKVSANGMVTIHAQTQNWWPAIRTHVPTQLSCSYNLWNAHYNKDVFYVRGDGYTWAWKGHTYGSDISLKKNIMPIEEALKKVISLKGVRYQYNDAIEGSNEDFRLGFIAQEVEPILPEAVIEMHDGKKAMIYTDLIAVLVEAIKEQQVQIDNLQAIVSEQTNDIIILKEQIDACCQKSLYYSSPNTLNENDEQNELGDESFTDEKTVKDVDRAKLYQNTPNPFTVNTEIRFDIPENMISAKLLIHDMQGTEIKSYNISTKGISNIIIQGSELPAGMYMYTLLVNNSVVDTKKMILTK